MELSKQEQFIQHYEKVHDQFERFCRARVYGDMEYTDLMNDSLLVAFQKLDQIQSQNFLSYLIGISIRILANNHRKKKALSINEFSAQVERVQAPNSQSDMNTEVQLLHEVLAMLPDEQRECLILFEITGFKIKEIAKMQETNESTVKQRLRRGRQRLKAILTFESTHKTGGEYE